MSFLAKSTISADIDDAVTELRNSFSSFPMRQLLFFSSTTHDPGTLFPRMRAAFPDATVFGCTSCEELCDARLTTDSIVALACGEGAFDKFAITVGENIGDDPAALDKAVRRLEEQLGEPLAGLDPETHFGLVIFDPLLHNIETFFRDLRERSSIVFAGGGASDFFTFHDLALCYNGGVYTNSAVLAVAKPRGKFSLLKTQSVKTTTKGFVVTGYNRDKRIIETLDGRPAAVVYAEALGLRPWDLGPDVFMFYPFAVMSGDEPYVRAICSITANNGIEVFFSVEEGERLTLLKTVDLVEETARAIEAKEKEMGGIKCVIDFDCVFRAMLLRKTGRKSYYADLFEGTESIGISTFGEVFQDYVNQTAVMVLLG